jgi:tetratricopeptide (TPR) repeat protein
MAISRKTLSEISPALRKTYDRAVEAANRNNFPYAMEMLRTVLREEPGCAEVREKLRETQLDSVGRTASMGRQIVAFLKDLPVFVFKGPVALFIKRDYAEALDAAEEALGHDPTFKVSIAFFKSVAVKAGLLEEAIKALEIGREHYEQDVKLRKELADLYMHSGHAVEATVVLQELQALMPNNGELDNQLRKATAQAAMESSAWGSESQDYQSKIRDKDAAQNAQDQGAIAPRGQESLERQLATAEEEISENPQNPGPYRRYADLLRRLGRYDESIEAYKKINEITGTDDPSIDDTITKVVSEKYNELITDLREKLAEKAGQDEKESIQSEIEKFEEEKNQTLLKAYEARVKKFPNEAQYRYDLAVTYQALNRLDDALKEFQKIQRNKRMGPLVHMNMARIFVHRHMYDFAIEHYNEVLEAGSQLSTTHQKEALYELATAYEEQGQADQAREMLKRLYDMDVGFKDVDARLRKYYH